MRAVLRILRARLYEAAVRLLRPPPCRSRGRDGEPCGRHLGHGGAHESRTRVWVG